MLLSGRAYRAVIKLASQFPSLAFSKLSTTSSAINAVKRRCSFVSDLPGAVWPSGRLSGLGPKLWGSEAILESYHKLQPQPKTIPEMNDAPERIWTALSQKSIAKGVKVRRTFASDSIGLCQLIDGILNIKFDH